MAKRKVGKEMTSRLKAALDSVKKKKPAAKPANKKPAASGPMYSPFVKKKPNLSSKQKDIAKQSGNPNKIEGSDLKKLRDKGSSKPAAKPTFGKAGVNPRTGKSYSESPGKSNKAPESKRTRSTKGRRYSSGATPMKSRPAGGSAPNRAARRRRGR